MVNYKLLLYVLDRDSGDSNEQSGCRISRNIGRQPLVSANNEIPAPTRAIFINSIEQSSCRISRNIGRQPLVSANNEIPAPNHAIFIHKNNVLQRWRIPRAAANYLPANDSIFPKGFLKSKLPNLPRDAAASGLTLIELLVVVFIIGILAAIALPTFFRLIDKAKESEATQYIGYLNKHQTAQYIEATGFTYSFGTLSFSQEQTATSAAAILRGFGFSVRESKNYLYGIKVSTYKSYPIAAQVAVSKNFGVRSYFGIVYAQDGNILLPCGPVAVDVSLASPAFKQVQIVTQFLANPEIYCPH